MPDFPATDGTRLHFEETGEATGRPVVLVAGFKAAASSWRYQLKPLADAGYRVIAFDRRGHGASAIGPDGGHTMDRHGRDLRDLLDTLELDDATVVGGSMGGNAIWAMLAASGSARVRDVVIVDQTPKMLNDADWPHGFYDYDASNVDTAFATGIPDPGRFPLRRKGITRIARLLRAMGGGGDRGFTPAELELLNDHAKRDWREAITAATVPALFVAGAESEFWPASHAAAAAALNPLATSAVIERDGHAANIEQPAAFNRGLLEWLAKGRP